MRHTYLLLGMLMSFCLQAQDVAITVTDEGVPMAYHNVTISYGDYVLGTGKTDAKGFVLIYAKGLRSKSIDVAGKYQRGSTKREWSIKGKLKLDSRNRLHIQLEKIGEDIEKSRAEIKKRSDELSNRIKKNLNRPSRMDDFEDDDDFNEEGDFGEEAKNNIDANSDFGRALKKIKNTFSSFEQKDLALDLVKKQQLNTTQIKQVLEEIKSSFSQKDIAIAAYKNCTDKKNYEDVIKTFLSKFIQEDVRKATIGK